MSWPVLVAVGTAIAAPWVGIIILVLVQANMAVRIAALEEKVTALAGDLGWKKE